MNIILWQTFLRGLFSICSSCGEHCPGSITEFYCICCCLWPSKNGDNWESPLESFHRFQWREFCSTRSDSMQISQICPRKAFRIQSQFFCTEGVFVKTSSWPEIGLSICAGCSFPRQASEFNVKPNLLCYDIQIAHWHDQMMFLQQVVAKVVHKSKQSLNFALVAVVKPGLSASFLRCICKSNRTQRVWVGLG